MGDIILSHKQWHQIHAESCQQQARIAELEARSKEDEQLIAGLREQLQQRTEERDAWKTLQGQTLRTLKETLSERDAQREQLASWMVAHGLTTGHGDTHADLLEELGTQVEELQAKLRESEEDTRRLEFVMDNRADLWNTHLKDRSAIDAAIAGK